MDRKENQNDTSTWIVMGIALGVTGGIIFDNAVIGIAVGLAMGLVISWRFNKKRNEK